MDEASSSLSPALPPPEGDVPETVHRLMQDASDEGAGKVHRVAFDASQRAMSRPPHWPAATCLGPGDYCTPRYMVVDYLGRGGIAEVYEVRDMLKETYEALKVVRIEGVRAEILEKVAAEARTLNRVVHPNLLRVHNAGVLAERKLLYFAMERLEGVTLQQKIARSEGARARPRRAAVAVREAVRIGIGIARGLNALHQAGIVHRDIKPENLFWTLGGELKVFDLDIAKFNDTCGVRATERGITMGTVLYMSPEHLHEGRADARSDIYATGFVLFELVAGHHAFASGPDDSPSHKDAIAWHTARRVPRLSNAIEGVPIGFDAIVRKCTEKDPAARYQDCSELVKALAALDEVLAAAEAREAERRKAEAAERGEVEGEGTPEVVVRMPGTEPSPRLAQMTTERTATAVPSVPIAVFPAPIWDTATQRTEAEAMGVRGGGAAREERGVERRERGGSGAVVPGASRAERGGSGAVGPGASSAGGGRLHASGGPGLALVPPLDPAASASAGGAVESAARPAAPSGVRPVEPASGAAAGPSSGGAAAGGAPATWREGGPAGTDVIVPASARASAGGAQEGGGEARSARPSRAPLLGRGGTEIIALPPRSSAGGPSWLPPERGRQGTGTADLPVVSAASPRASSSASEQTAELPAVTEAAAGAVVVGARQASAAAGPAVPSSRHRRGAAARAVPYVLCVLATVALTSLAWMWIGRVAPPAGLSAPMDAPAPVTAPDGGTVEPAEPSSPSATESPSVASSAAAPTTASTASSAAAASNPSEMPSASASSTAGGTAAPSVTVKAPAVKEPAAKPAAPTKGAPSAAPTASTGSPLKTWSPPARRLPSTPGQPASSGTPDSPPPVKPRLPANPRLPTNPRPKDL